MNNQILLNLITEAKNHGLKGKSMIDNTDEKYVNTLSRTITPPFYYYCISFIKLFQVVLKTR